MVIVVNFNPNCVAGKTVEVELEHGTKDNENAVELAGTWLIYESTHVMDRNGIPYSQLEISKPQIQVDSTHPFKKEFKA
jgi:hypothetical protein